MNHPEEVRQRLQQSKAAAAERREAEAEIRGLLMVRAERRRENRRRLGLHDLAGGEAAQENQVALRAPRNIRNARRCYVARPVGPRAALANDCMDRHEHRRRLGLRNLVAAAADDRNERHRHRQTLGLRNLSDRADPFRAGQMCFCLGCQF